MYCTSTRWPWPDDADCTWLQSGGATARRLERKETRGLPPRQTLPHHAESSAANSTFFQAGGREQGRRPLGLFPRGLSSLGQFPPHKHQFLPGRSLPCNRPRFAPSPVSFRTPFALPPNLQHSTRLQTRKRLNLRMEPRRKWSQLYKREASGVCVCVCVRGGGIHTNGRAGEGSDGVWETLMKDGGAGQACLSYYGGGG